LTTDEVYGKSGRNEIVASHPAPHYLTVMELEAAFTCTYCFQVNELFIDVSAGLRQEYEQDCEVCCKPNRLVIVIDPDAETAEVNVEPA
jgi:hypothetical protein